MLYESLDDSLESGIASICDNDWTAAQTFLSQRLEESVRLGGRRLNLFLLSVVAQRVGLPDTASELAQAAKNTPLEMGEPRYFGRSEDPVRRQLEMEWWSFNGWQTENQPSLATQSVGEDELNWAAILDGALEGRAGEMERRWSRFLEGDRPERPLLWNFLALSYLESGDLRTYEEMRDQASTSATLEIPEPLAQLLSHAGLHGALSDLAGGRWLTSEGLHNVTAGQEETAPGSSALAWEVEMEASFSLMSVGSGMEAARKLGNLSLQGQPLHRAYALNALALALFSSGEYAGAEEALADSRGEAARAEAQDDELAARYAYWLASVGARPADGSTFCDPFSEVMVSGEGSQEGGAGEDAFWPILEEVLEGMRVGDLASCQRTLRRLLSEPSSKESTRAFLVALLFAGNALLEGDHMEAQEAIDDASRLLQQGGFEAGTLVEAQGRFAAAGALTLAGKLELESLATLDPWRDFPADFQQQSYNGY